LADQLSRPKEEADDSFPKHLKYKQILLKFTLKMPSCECGGFTENVKHT
jgi:hypothetical protein